MTPREQLEYAAKACGIEITPIEMNNVAFQGDYRFIGFMTKAEQWGRGWFDPHTDQADSDRMGAKLRIDIEFYGGYVEASKCTPNTDQNDWDKFDWACKSVSHNNTDEDVFRAVREARMAVAVEIGRMK